MLIILAPNCQQQQLDQLNADIDEAVEVHAIQASRLQQKLDSLDAQLLDDVLCRLPTPPEAIERRRQILAELDVINQTLEQRCQRNQREIDLLESAY